MRAAPVPVLIVLPCLDEAPVLGDTCRSLGFGTGPENQPVYTTLIIVDNGSTDDTLSVAREIQRCSRPGTVLLAHEPERGYVPPRRTGNLLARSLTEANTPDGSRHLILQADADTRYCEGYVAAMQQAAVVSGPHTLLEGGAEFSPDVHEQLGPYLRLLADIDEAVLSRIALSPEDELVCTDAVSAYRLGDYFAWGGHEREHAEGEEIHAETTRLRIRSLPWSGKKVRVWDAVAFPSERKTILRPAEEFASAGFPRGERWRSAWRRDYSGPTTAHEFGTARDHPEVMRAIRFRERHLLALFGLLPVHAARALGTSAPQADPGLLRLAASLPARDASTLTNEPGRLITDVLEVVDHRPRALDELLG